MMEFCVCCLIIMPLLVGLCGGGVMLVRQIELSQVCRDAGHMYARGIDFTRPENQQLIVQIAGSLNYGTATPSGGLTLTTVTYVTDTVCAAGNHPTGCTNKGAFVITKQVKIGNPVTSSVGDAVNPSSVDGSVNQNDYLTNKNDQVKVFPSAIENLWINQANVVQSQQFAYVSEASVQARDLAWTGIVSPWISAWSVF